MTKLSKTLRSAYKTIDREKLYTIEEAVKLMKKTSSVKFDATAELHAKLAINPKHAEQQVRTTTTLPNGTGKKVRVAAFCEDDQQKAAKAAGATAVGAEELVEKVTKGWLDFDVAVSTPGMMKHLAKIARVLGPKGLMPNPKAGTVGPDVAKIVTEVAGGRLEFRNDKSGIIHTVFGKLSFDEKKLTENLTAMIDAIKTARPAAVKGTYIETISVNATMGAGIKINPA
ncbi:50S ribosomal protein L1 [bacterium]|jgi:large subunit ribosomal protein L1|nr:50S ribosomal protein L1 [bacterium]MBT6831500.1 50S ribosomal protein L1 [bacterium]MBT6996054.1 50S ribosomal protein L1 [bacterium]MBT7772175.1 50S ribosomal protein L1 [bacterium]